MKSQVSPVKSSDEEQTPAVVAHGDWRVRVEPGRVTDGRTLLLLHGWTGDEHSMWDFTHSGFAGHQRLAPRGPFAVPQGGYAWREIQPDSWGFPSVQDLQPMVVPLFDLVDGLSREMGCPANTIDILGYSQGAVLALLMVLVHPERVRRLGIMAGFLPQGVESLVNGRPLQNKAIRVVHGLRDNQIPIDRAREAVHFLSGAGAIVSFEPVDAGHGLRPEQVPGLDRFFAV